MKDERDMTPLERALRLESLPPREDCVTCAKCVRVKNVHYCNVNGKMLIPRFMKIGRCMHVPSDYKPIDCEFCCNAFTDRDLQPDNDLGYISVGRTVEGVHAYMRASASYKPPVCLVVDRWDESKQLNMDIAHFTPKYCPMCGRKILENEPYLKDGRGRGEQ